jgi:predicted nuclease of predicted toxin-antitoxin system
MRFKTDENVHPAAAKVLREHGHDTSTVWGQGLQGKPDGHIAAACHAEGRALLSFDLDFADIRQYPPGEYCGLVVLRLQRQDRPHLLNMLSRALPLLQEQDLSGRLWIVDEAGIRVHGGDDEA